MAPKNHARSQSAKSYLAIRQLLAVSYIKQTWWFRSLILLYFSAHDIFCTTTVARSPFSELWPCLEALHRAKS